MFNIFPFRPLHFSWTKRKIVAESNEEFEYSDIDGAYSPQEIIGFQPQGVLPLQDVPFDIPILDSDTPGLIWNMITEAYKKMNTKLDWSKVSSCGNPILCVTYLYTDSAQSQNIDCM